MPCPYVFPFLYILFWHGLWYHESPVKGGGSMVLRATLVVLCIVLGLALFSSAEENGWIWGVAVGVVVASAAVGIEYTLRRAKPGFFSCCVPAVALCSLIASRPSRRASPCPGR